MINYICMKKNYLSAIKILFCLCLFVSCQNSSHPNNKGSAKKSNEGKISISGTYHYSTSNGGGVTYELHSDKTATVTVKIGSAYPVSFNGYWETNTDGFVVIHSNGSSEILNMEEMCLYQTLYDAKSKVNCIELIKK